MNNEDQNMAFGYQDVDDTPALQPAPRETDFDMLLKQAMKRKGVKVWYRNQDSQNTPRFIENGLRFCM